MENIFLYTSHRLAQYLEQYVEFQGIIKKVQHSSITGLDLLQNSVEAFLYMIGENDLSDTLVSTLQRIKQQHLQQLQETARPLVYLGCLLEKNGKTLTICSPSTQTQIFDVDMLMTHVVLAGSAKYEPGAICELIYQAEELQHIVIHQKAYYMQVPPSTALHSYVNKASPPENSSPASSLHLEPPQPPTAQLQPFSFTNGTDITQVAEQQDFFSQPFQTGELEFPQDVGVQPEAQHTKVKFSLKETASQPLQTRLSSIPQAPAQFRYTTNIRVVGRVDFLIESTAFVVVPCEYLGSLRPGNRYGVQDVRMLREFNLAQGSALVVGVQTALCDYEQGPTPVPQTSKAGRNGVLQRGDVVELELVPGYGCGLVGCSQGNAGYPLVGQRHGPIKRQAAADFEEYYRGAGEDEHLTPYGTAVRIVDRIERAQVSRNHLVYGQTYVGYVYTFNDQDGFGFIKSYGGLTRAGDYSQGFEVYFKLQQNQRQQYIPQRGDLVQFRSHWVDEKAQAREIRLLQRNDMGIVPMQCVGICPPYAVFSLLEERRLERNLSYQELRSNLLFSKVKGAQGIRLGQRVHAQFDPDISSHFKAQSLQCEPPLPGHQGGLYSFSLAPQNKQPQELLPLPWESVFTITRLSPVFRPPRILQENVIGKVINFDTIVTEQPLVLQRLGIQVQPATVLEPIEPVISKQYYCLYSLGGNNIALVAGGHYNGFEYYGISTEYVFMRHHDKNIGFVVHRNKMPSYCIYVDDVTIQASLSVDQKYDCYSCDGIYFIQCDAEICVTQAE